MRAFPVGAMLFGLAIVSGPLHALGETKAQQQADVQNATNSTLARLYQAQPGSKQAIQNAAGYAVFTNFGLKILFAGGGSGKGVAVNNKTKARTYMRMVEVQAGLGLGVKKYQLVWVFETPAALNNFINSGWELGAQATAAAQVGSTGGSFAGAVAIAPGVWLYQLTDDGLALELTAKGTKYFKDGDLN